MGNEFWTLQVLVIISEVNFNINQPQRRSDLIFEIKLSNLMKINLLTHNVLKMSQKYVDLIYMTEI